MNVTAEKVIGLVTVDEIADRPAAGMQAIAHAVERRAQRRGVAAQHQWGKGFKMRQTPGQLGFAVLAGGVEGRWARVTETRDLILADAHDLLVEIVKAELLAEGGDLRNRLVVPGENLYFAGAGLHDFSTGLEAARPIHQVAGSEIVIGLSVHEAFERVVVAVDVGKNEQLHGLMIAPEAALSCCRR